MNNILNAQEAFAALQKGKTVLCRYAGNGNLHADKNFSTLDQMPATVFVLPNYEFCVQVEMLELAGITFTKPITIDEYQDDQEVFVICTYSPSIYVMNFKTSALIESINSGFVQRDAENAKLQLKAISKALGHELNSELSIVRLGKEPTKPKRKKEPEVKNDLDPQIEHNKDLIIDAIATCVTAEEVETTCFGLDKMGFNEKQLNTIFAVKSQKLEKLADEKATAENAADELLNQNQVDTPDPELSVLCDAFVDEINAAVSADEIKAIRTRINSNGDLTEVESAELATRINLKSASFEKEQSPVPFENIAAAAVAQAKKVDEETQEREWTRFHNDKPYLDLGNKSQYEIEYADLSAVVIHAQSSDEANSVVEKTHHWTTDQRNPLLSLISKRLCELQEQSKVQPKEPPSLMVQIQNAPDLTTLDALEIDVSARHPDIQPRLMGYVKKRRFELEQIESASSDGGHAS